MKLVEAGGVEETTAGGAGDRRRACEGVFSPVPTLFFCFCAISRAASEAYGGSQARGIIRAVAAGLHHSHSTTGSEPRL